jgi:hypothetical protein
LAITLEVIWFEPTFLQYPLKAFQNLEASTLMVTGDDNSLALKE